MELLELTLPGGRRAEASVVGPDAGRPVLYFHSPSTSGEELGGAEAVAEQLNLRMITLRRPSVVCEQPAEFVDVVASDASVLVDRVGLEQPTLTVRLSALRGISALIP